MTSADGVSHQDERHDRQDERMTAHRVVYRGGFIRTPSVPGATALCVEGDTITWLGHDDNLSGYLPGADEIVDLRGRLVTPAFVDAHVHLSQTGLRLASLDLSDAASREAVLDALAARARQDPAAVILGFGWDETAWPDPRPPTLDELDRAAPQRPVYLARVDVHSALVSSGLVARAPAITTAPGWDGTGRVERDAHHLARDTAHALITRSQRESAIHAALDAAGAAGLGCVHEMAAPHLNPEDDLALLAQPRTRPTVEVVTYWGEHASSRGVERAQRLGCAGAAGDLCVDGALGSHTAALDKPYDDRPDHTGYLYLDVDQIAEHVVACTRAGLQAGFHCIGDAAVGAVVDGLRRAERRVGLDALRARRHRLEHAEMVAPELLPTLATYGVVISGQPAFDADWGGPAGMYARRLGADRALLTNPWASILRAGVPLAFGSDSPVTPFDPWGAVRAAVHHHHPDARISVEQAFTAHTRGGWYAAGRDAGGELAVGAPATFAVWDHPGPHLPDLHLDAPAPACVRTVVRGRTVYDRETDDRERA
jgi:hypothetical protein